MSYREIRALTERLRALGYGPVVSLESFRVPNFELVADILAWLVLSYDSNASIPLTISTEDERVAFIKTAVEFLATGAQIRLNPLKLYTADGSAVRELLKLVDSFIITRSTIMKDDIDAPLLRPSGAFHIAAQTDPSSGKRPMGQSLGTNPSSIPVSLASQIGGMVGKSIVGDLSSKSAVVRAARDLAADLTTRGAVLYELLGTESSERELRANALSRAIDLPSLKSAAEESLNSAKQQVQNLTQLISTIGSDTTNLISKIDKKRSDLERRKKRLTAMQGVRPAYMDEFERVEAELKDVYSLYVRSVRNLSYLENIVEETNRMELEESEEAERSLKRLQERVKEEEINMLRGGTEDGDDSEEESYGFGMHDHEKMGENGSPESVMLDDSELGMILNSRSGKSHANSSYQGVNYRNQGGSALGDSSDIIDSGDDEGEDDLDDGFSHVLSDQDDELSKLNKTFLQKPKRKMNVNSRLTKGETSKISKQSILSRLGEKSDKSDGDFGDEGDSIDDDEDSEMDDDLVSAGLYAPRSQKDNSLTYPDKRNVKAKSKEITHQHHMKDQSSRNPSNGIKRQADTHLYGQVRNQSQIIEDEEESDDDILSGIIDYGNKDSRNESSLALYGPENDF